MILVAVLTLWYSEGHRFMISPPLHHITDVQFFMCCLLEDRRETAWMSITRSIPHCSIDRLAEDSRYNLYPCVAVVTSTFHTIWASIIAGMCLRADKYLIYDVYGLLSLSYSTQCTPSPNKLPLTGPEGILLYQRNEIPIYDKEPLFLDQTQPYNIQWHSPATHPISIKHRSAYRACADPARTAALSSNKKPEILTPSYSNPA